MAVVYLIVYIYILICIFFTLWLNILALFDSIASSGKPFQVKDPKYDKHLWLKALVLSGWKSFKEEFFVAISIWSNVR